MKNNYKKYLLFGLIILLTFFVFCPETLASDTIDYNSICSNDGIKKAMRIVGYVIQIAKWVVPLIIIVLGMIDFTKATISNDDSAVSKATGALIRRIIAGIIVFFVPTIVMAVLNVIEITKGIEKVDNSEFGACTKCLFDPANSCSISGDNLNTTLNNNNNNIAQSNDNTLAYCANITDEAECNNENLCEWKDIEEYGLDANTINGSYCVNLYFLS